MHSLITLKPPKAIWCPSMYSLCRPKDWPSSSGEGLLTESLPQRERNADAGDKPEDADRLDDCRLSLRRLQARVDLALSCRNMGHGSEPMRGVMIGDAVGEAVSGSDGEMGVCTPSSEVDNVDADVIEADCADPSRTPSWESMVESFGAVSLLLVRRLTGSPVKGLILHVCGSKRGEPCAGLPCHLASSDIDCSRLRRLVLLDFGKGAAIACCFPSSRVA